MRSASEELVAKALADFEIAECTEEQVITRGLFATVIMLSFSSIGVPGGGSAFKTLPAYLAAGIPIEGIIVAEAVETIPDIFKTLLNVTGDMSAATLLSRGSRAPALAAGGILTAPERAA